MCPTANSPAIANSASKPGGFGVGVDVVVGVGAGVGSTNRSFPAGIGSSFTTFVSSMSGSSYITIDTP